MNFFLMVYIYYIYIYKQTNKLMSVVIYIGYFTVAQRYGFYVRVMKTSHIRYLHIFKPQ